MYKPKKKKKISGNWHGFLSHREYSFQPCKRSWAFNILKMNLPKMSSWNIGRETNNTISPQEAKTCLTAKFRLKKSTAWHFQKAVHIYIHKRNTPTSPHTVYRKFRSKHTLIPIWKINLAYSSAFVIGTFSYNLVQTGKKKKKKITQSQVNYCMLRYYTHMMTLNCHYYYSLALLFTLGIFQLVPHWKE